MMSKILMEGGASDKPAMASKVPSLVLNFKYLA